MKIFASILAIMLVISFVIFGLIRVMMLQIYERRFDAELLNNATQLAWQLSNEPQNQWNRLISVFRLENNADVSISDNRGNFMYGALIINEYGVSVHDVAEGGIIIPFANNYQGFSLSVDSRTITNTLLELEGIFTQIFLYVLIFILVIAVIIAFLYARFLGKPIIEIAHVSKKLANVELAWQCKTNRTDEIGILAYNLNHMAQQLSTTLDELQSANIKLQDDIKKEREHERRRRDFFAAVSHELKTPVTILKGELDGMILNVGKFKDRDKYLQEAYKTSESIERLVREIMTLAKLDTINLDIEQVNLSSIVTEVVKRYELLAVEKQLDIQLNCKADVFLQADKAQMQTVVSNVVSNAVKYSAFGQSVKVNLDIDSKSGVLIVENAGAYIDENEIAKLWEPFYRTEKSRNRDTGGSGLGLYIVKTILNLHHFSYKLENYKDGIRFTVNFPAC